MGEASPLKSEKAVAIISMDAIRIPARVCIYRLLLCLALLLVCVSAAAAVVCLSVRLRRRRATLRGYGSSGQRVHWRSGPGSLPQGKPAIYVYGERHLSSGGGEP